MMAAWRIEVKRILRNYAFDKPPQSFLSIAKSTIAKRIRGMTAAARIITESKSQARNGFQSVTTNQTSAMHKEISNSFHALSFSAGFITLLTS
jgi:predicted GNAT superfamily acetyltransferase